MGMPGRNHYLEKDEECTILVQIGAGNYEGWALSEMVGVFGKDACCLPNIHSILRVDETRVPVSLFALHYATPGQCSTILQTL